MLQAYSSNISFAANTPIPLHNAVITKGCAEKLTAPATIELNKRGVYMVEVDGYATGADAGVASIQLYRDGVAVPYAQSQFNAAAGDVMNFQFQTLIQVQQNNCNCNCLTSPVVLQVMNGDEALTAGYLNVVVTKLC